MMKESVSLGGIQYDRRLQAVGDVVIRSIIEWAGSSEVLVRDLYCDGANVLQCVSGRFRFTLDGVKSIELGGGEALVSYPGHRMTMEAQEGECRLVSVVLCGVSVKNYLDSMGFFHGQSGRTVLQCELLAKIRNLLDRQPVENRICLSLLSDILQSMAQDFREQGNAFILDAVRLIRSNLEHGLVRLEPLCEQLRVSRAHLHSAFVQAGLGPPSAFIRNEQRQLAISLLQTTTLSVTEIAHRAGFISMTHFANFMRKYTGKSAREWRLDGRCQTVNSGNRQIFCTDNELVDGK